jgi:hypothetical protein
MKLIPMIQGCCQLDSPRVATVHAPRGVMLVPTALQRRPLIGMHADRSAAPGPVPSAGQASMSTAAKVKVGSGTDAQHPHVFLPNAHTHAHSRNSKRLGRAGRRGAAHAASSSSAQETGRHIIAYKAKTSGSYGSSCPPSPSLDKPSTPAYA